MGELKKTNQEVKEKAVAQAQTKLSYEQLEQAANQLMQANQQAQQINQQLKQQLEQQNYGNFHQRMIYLFEVVKNPSAFPVDFVNNCRLELQNTLTLPEPSEAKEDNQ